MYDSTALQHCPARGNTATPHMHYLYYVSANPVLAALGWMHNDMSLFPSSYLAPGVLVYALLVCPHRAGHGLLAL